MRQFYRSGQVGAAITLSATGESQADHCGRGSGASDARQWPDTDKVTLPIWSQAWFSPQLRSGQDSVCTLPTLNVIPYGTSQTASVRLINYSLPSFTRGSFSEHLDIPVRLLSLAAAVLHSRVEPASQYHCRVAFHQKPWVLAARLGSRFLSHL